MFESLFIFIWTILYEACSLLCWIMQCIYEMFEVFAGLRMVQYKGKDTFLIDVFFGNDAISRVYWGMATIGIVLCFAFTIIAVIRKMFDSEDKMQATLGNIISNMIKSILIILMMNFIITVVLNVTNVVLQQVDYAFGGGAYAMGESEKEIVFTEEDFATMARIYNVIGNHAINSSYDSRMNINSCFNAIRKDMLLLEKKGIFDYDYDYNENGQLEANWQSVLVPIARARSLSEDIKIDEYDTSLVEAIIRAMEILQSGSDFRPLQVYGVPAVAMLDEDTKLDAIVMITGTMSAAENKKYNENPSIFDALRSPYILGEKDIHNISDVESDFDLSKIDYILIILSAAFLGYQMIFLAINAIARIFNMLLLYLAFPPIMAVTPLDDGGKRKQWTVAFVVQSVSIFGTVMAMRLVTFCIPIIYSDSLNLFPDSSLSGPRNYLVKLFFILAVAFTANKSIGMLSGILADSAGYQSMSAANIGDGVVGEIKSGYKNAKGFANFLTGKKDKKDKQQDNKAGSGKKDSGGGSSSGGGSGSSSGGGAEKKQQNNSSLGDKTDTMGKPKETANPTNTQGTQTDNNQQNNNNNMSQGNENTQDNGGSTQNVNQGTGNTLNNREMGQTEQKTSGPENNQVTQGTNTNTQGTNGNLTTSKTPPVINYNKKL